MNHTTPSSFPAVVSFPNGETVLLDAVPALGYRFDGWGGDLSGSDNPASVTMSCRKTVSASFRRVMHTLTVQVDGQGSTTPDTGNRSYALGASVVMTAVPDSGWQFDGWTGDVDDPASATTSVTMDSSKTVTATFSRIVHTLALRTTGNGTVTPSASEGEYVEGSVVEVTAIPDSGWRFEGWTGDVSGPDEAATTVVMGSDRVITAVFTRIMHSLTIRIDGSGSTVPAEGVYSHAEGTAVDIEAVPDKGWWFDGWSGSVTEPELASTALTVDSDMTITASFSRATPVGQIAGGVAAGVVMAGAAVWWLLRGWAA